MIKFILSLSFCFALLTPAALAKGSLSDNIRISSQILGYDLQYRIYVPETAGEADKLPTLYITDGASYIKSGGMVKVLDEQISKGRIKPVIAVFVDARDPDDLKVNRRNEQFFCKKNYVDFFTLELLPQITKDYPVSTLREDRVILGVSFGGFNAGCFGLMATPYFGGIAMNSPAHAKFVRYLQKQYKKFDKKNLKIYMSVGNAQDNREAVNSFRRSLKKKGYELTYSESYHGHNWDNWRPLLPKILKVFFAQEAENDAAE